MIKLLLVEDDESLAIGIEFTLKDEGYEILRACTIKQANECFEANEIDLIILDVNLPDGNGYDLCREIRKKNDVPIMFLTALDEEVNIVLGLEIGGDDYITKPFRVRELLSRVKALLRRNSKNLSTGNKLKSWDLEIDTSTASVKKLGKEITLTAQEYKLLLTFLYKPGVILKRDEILKELIEGEDVFFDENTLSVYIKRIREKIEDDSKIPEYIVTQRGLGYMWNKEVSQ
ncbi:response regulator transcription factor [Clostridium sp. 'White wine YQ']|uniref:response regulator transcription factor n=1 Tax=Clostridium sp. 'White wine YQ' TaxID=3027474 RepID=UPI0023665F86|nr:response regulator transcription factor [Clostridium sp. 'White wine YQ']MDD7794827.1 response regulator transcription factor [Clostridium sp. 'White wine YQ']